MILLFAMFFFPENEELFNDLSEDYATISMFSCDIICIIPFLTRAIYKDPNTLSQFPRLVLRAFGLLSTIKIFRAIKDNPVIYTLQVTITASIPHLVLPIFFFMLFNIFFGVVMYFIEPCYDYRICPWTDVFDSCFFSVVTMTTSKSFTFMLFIDMYIYY